MNTQTRMVREFALKFGGHVEQRPTLPDPEKLDHLSRLFNEEVDEFNRELVALRDFAERAKATGDTEGFEKYLADMTEEGCDVGYFQRQIYLLCGVDDEPVFRLKHEANMAKDPSVRDESGKVLKPPGWQKPDIEAEIRRQGEPLKWEWDGKNSVWNSLPRSGDGPGRFRIYVTRKGTFRLHDFCEADHMGMVYESLRKAQRIAREIENDAKPGVGF